MSEEALTIAAVAVELGIPLVATLLFWRRPALRPRLVVILGAITPVLIFYAAITVSFLIDSDDPGNRFAFFAAWIMSFFVYFAILVAGLLLSIVPKPIHLGGRYALGFVSPALVVSLLIL